LNDNEFRELLDKITKKTIEKIESIFSRLGDDIEVIDVDATVEEGSE